MTDLIQKKCAACEAGGQALTPDQVQTLRVQVPAWTVAKDSKQISRMFTFKDFASALAFADKVGEIAESEGHHPDLHVSWGKVLVELWTHAVGGLSENDFIMAAKIDHIQIA
jgi:4a-hydroxytetrahydrobiopterin dehydratase